MRALEVLMKGTAVNVVLLEDSDATIESVKVGMKSHGWVHFACHAVQDVDQPLLSGLCLHDGRLELLEIMKEQIPNANFAFISASETSKGDPNLSEEVVHFTAGMLAAGYRGVVGTMWSISDVHGPEFATEFYQYLLRENERLDSTRAAYALDYATRTVRERIEKKFRKVEMLVGLDSTRATEIVQEQLRDPDSEREMNTALFTWVPYVHFGY